MKDCVLALGFFDGVHLGHGGLLRKTRALADRMDVRAAALTFAAHPDALLSGAPVSLLNTPEERAQLMRSLYGIDEVYILPFDRDVMRQTWQDFFTCTVRGLCHARAVVCGHDFRCGAGGEGTPDRLRARCVQEGMTFCCIPEIRLEGKTVSSTLIRTLLQEGQAEKAARFLGHPHLMSGTVVQGKQLGRRLGFPTANLRLHPDILLPKYGVYAGDAYVDGLHSPAVVNIGCRPTVDGGAASVEAWLPRFSGDLYGRRMWLALRTFLRPEEKFPDLAALRAAVLRDGETTLRLADEREKNGK